MKPGGAPLQPERANSEANGKVRRLCVVLGTRPEAIKLAPVITALRARPHFETTVLSTGQHREMLDQAMGQVGIVPDRSLDLMTTGQSLSEVTQRVVAGMDRLLRELAPDLLVVQGDTTTTMAASLGAFHRQVPVAHVEAGLRSANLHDPFPEEMNRRVTSLVSDLHLAPTPLARDRLLAEGVDPRRIAVTGNTVVDSLLALRAQPFSTAGTVLAGLPPAAGRMVLITSHRRESFGGPLEATCRAVRTLAERFPEVSFVFPVHANPNVRRTVEQLLGRVPGVHLLPPVGYREFLHLLEHCHFVVTDSGGVQEEAPTMGKPLLLLRRLTERPEALEAGLARLVGGDGEALVVEASRLLEDEAAWRSMVATSNPYGDGQAGERCGEAIERWLARLEPLLPADRQFAPEIFVPRVVAGAAT